MTFGKTALRCWLPQRPAAGAALPAARGGCAGGHGDPRQCPHRRRGGGRRLYGGADARWTRPPRPVQRALTVKNGGTVYFTGFAFDEPGDYRYLVAERSGGAAHTTYDAHSYTVTVRVTGRPDGGLAAGLWAVRSGETAKADGVLFVNLV